MNSISRHILINLKEGRGGNWPLIFDMAKELDLSDEEATRFTDYFWSLRGHAGAIYISKEIKEAIPEISKYSSLVVTDLTEKLDHSLALKILQYYVDKFRGVDSFVNNGEERVSIDLQNAKLRARQILFDVMGDEYMIKNDTRPIFVWGDLGDHTLGNCHYRDDKPKITIHNAFKKNKELKDEYFMNTCIHEYIHSLKSCRNEGHGGEFMRVAKLVSNNTDYAIDQYASSIESFAFHKDLES